jgi:hypothetical protein
MEMEPMSNPAQENHAEGCSGRRGMTLLDIMVSMSILSVLLTVSAIWIHRILLFSITLGERQRDHANLVRLATDLRQDIQFSRRWSMPKADELVLEINDHWQIRYQLEKVDDQDVMNVQHFHSSKDISDPRQPAPNRREQFNFSSQCEITWDAAEFPASLLLTATRRPFPVAETRLEVAAASAGSPVLEEREGHNLLTPNRDQKQAISRNSQPVEMVLRLVPHRWPDNLNRESEDTR